MVSSSKPDSDLQTQKAVMQRMLTYRELPILPTGFPVLDDVLMGGFRAGEMYSLAAGTGQGKTSFACQIARQHAARGGYAIIWSLEMEPFQLQAKMVAQETGLPFLKVLHTMPPADLERYVARLETLQYYCGRDIKAFQAAAEQVIREAGNATILIILDYLQKLGAPGQDVREAVTLASECLRSLAQRSNATILTISAVSRESARRIRESRNLWTGEDLVDVGRESGAIEYDVAGMFVLALDPAERDNQRKAVLSVAKNRFGYPGQQIEHTFDGRTGIFTELGRLESKRVRAVRELRQRISQAVVAAGGPLSKSEIYQATGGKKQTCFREIDAMVQDGALEQIGARFALGRTDAGPGDAALQAGFEDTDTEHLDEPPDWLEAPCPADEDAPGADPDGEP
jgi:replicative DNA helicase